MARILVVDGAARLRLQLAELLTEAGYEVELAADGETASCLAAEYVFDLVLLDIDLPCPAGVDLVALFQRRLCGAPIMLMTEQLTIPTAVAVRVGVCAYLVKPVVKELLWRAVAQAVQAKQQQDQRHELEIANQRYQALLEGLVEEGSQVLQGTITALQTLQGRMQQQTRLTVLGQMVRLLTVTRPVWQAQMSGKQIQVEVAGYQAPLVMLGRLVGGWPVLIMAGWAGY